MEIELKFIRTDGGTQPREKLDMFVVDEYAQAMQAGAQFPPLTAFYDGQTYWLADGYHRYHAIRQLGWPKALVEVRQGTRREAVLYSCGANAGHGMRRTNQDKRRAVNMLLSDSEWQKWSDREIARRCQVANTLVSNLRREGGGESLLLPDQFLSSSKEPASLISNNTQATESFNLVTNIAPMLPEYESLSTVDSDSYSGNTNVTNHNNNNSNSLPDSPGKGNSSFLVTDNEARVLREERELAEEARVSGQRVYITKFGTLSTMRLPQKAKPLTGLPEQPVQFPNSGVYRREITELPLSSSSPLSPPMLSQSIPVEGLEQVAPAGADFSDNTSVPPPAYSLPAGVRRALADTPIRERPDELTRLARLNPADQTKVVGLITQNYQTEKAKPLTVQQALNQHRHEQAETTRLALLTERESRFTQDRTVQAAGSDNSNIGLSDDNELWTVTTEQGVVECEMVLADPPYGILKGVDWEPQEVSQLETFSREWAIRWGEQSGAGVIAIFWSEDYLFEGRHWFDESLPDYDFQQLLIWHFPNTLKPIGRGYFRNSFDPIFIYRRKGAPVPTAGSTNWPAGVTQSDCHVGAIPQSNYLEVDRKFHPAQKPLSVALWLLSILSQPGDRVADPFCGSGTFGVAAVQLGRVYHGIETNEEYQKLARHRITTYGLTEALIRKPQSPSQVRFEAI